MLSNILMHGIYDRIFAAVASDYVTYTRYADDMTFSAPRTGFLTGMMSAVAKIPEILIPPA
jgi:RNA-directed DNA polymerase